jgi:hypothetical protein
VETPARDRRVTELFDWPEHPAAAAFRLMTEDELVQLAADIKANGLLYPIVRGFWEDNGLPVHGVIDGRNRLRACKIAKVEPSFIEFKGEDACDFIASVNGERRNVTTGQKALAHALIYPDPVEPAQRGRGHKTIRSDGFLQPRIYEARAVIEHAPELIENVKNGIITLDNAYRQAAERKKAKEWLLDGMRQLRQIAPDLAARVDAGDIAFDEARTLLNERENEARQVRQTIFQGLRDFVRDGQGFAKGKRLPELPQWLEVEEYETEFRRYFPGGVPELVEKAKSLNDAAAVVNRIVAQLDQKRRGRK